MMLALPALLAVLCLVSSAGAAAGSRAPQSPGGGLVVAPCFNDASGYYKVLEARQTFSFDLSHGGKVVGAEGQCLTVAAQPAVTGSPVVMAPCGAVKAGAVPAGQDWAPIANVSTGSLRLRRGAAIGLQNGGLTNAKVWIGPHTAAHFVPKGAKDGGGGGGGSAPSSSSPSTGTFIVEPRAGFNHAVGCGRGCTLCITAGPPLSPCERSYPSPAAGFPMCE
jgi:hypothetical protein